MRAAAERAGWLAAKGSAPHELYYNEVQEAESSNTYDQIESPAEGSRAKLGLI